MVAFEGQTEPAFVQGLTPDYPHIWVRMGEVGKVLTFLQKFEASHVVFAGGIRRPPFSALSLDWLGIQWMAKIGWKRALGDDALLSQISALLAGEGLTIIGTEDFLSDLLVPKGIHSTVAPTEEDWVDINRGMEVAKILGQADVGQGVVVAEGLVLAVEALEGTQGLLERIPPLKKLLKRVEQADDKKAVGVLVKCAKPGQLRTIDLPTIGPDTFQQALAAGLRGIAVEAGSTQWVNPLEIKEKADEYGLFFIGV